MTSTHPHVRSLRIGSRGSALALTQTRQFAALLEGRHPGLRVEIEVIRTTGDAQQSWKSTPAALGASGGKGIFVKELEEALLERRIDAAVHSMKDMPTDLPGGLGIVAVPRREDPHDVLVTRDGLPFEELASGARIGTGSPRRISQLRNRRADLEYVPIRGNVDTRTRKASSGELDGVVLAAAGLNRLGLVEARRVVLPPELCLPAPGQGALAIEAREEPGWVLDVLGTQHDAGTAECVEAERAFLEELGGGCLVPAAALAEKGEGRIRLRAAVAEPDGSRVVRVDLSGEVSEASELGRQAARQAAREGGASILEALRGGQGG